MDWTTLLFGSLLAAWILWRFVPFIQARRLRGSEAPNFDDLVAGRCSGDGKWLIYFWSPACMMCPAMSAVIDELCKAHDNIIKINAMERTDVARRFRIMGTPTLVVVNAGKVERLLVGAKSKQQIVALLN